MGRRVALFTWETKKSSTLSVYVFWYCITSFYETFFCISYHETDNITLRPITNIYEKLRILRPYHVLSIYIIFLYFFVTIFSARKVLINTRWSKILRTYCINSYCYQILKNKNQTISSLIIDSRYLVKPWLYSVYTYISENTKAIIHMLLPSYFIIVNIEITRIAQKKACISTKSWANYCWRNSYTKRIYT